MSDAKEWVTVKIPECVRDTARDDPRTYGEIMRAGLDDGQEPDASDMGGVESSLQAIEERTGRIEQTLEELAEGRR